MRRGRLLRYAAVVIGAAVALAATAVIGYRVFAPHETLTGPTVAYPGVEVITDERPYSELRAAPLVVEGRLRVYAEKWRVWSDAPVGERYESTPYWAYRRWPAQVVGVVTAQTTSGPVVVTQWSDGEIVALDARRGSIAWRLNAPIAQGRHYDGRRTGASVVYTPRSLLTGRAGQLTVLFVTGPGEVRALNAATGVPLWRHQITGGCEPAAWTGATLLILPDCGGAGLTMLSVVDGAERQRWVSPDPATVAKPSVCELNRSECRLVTVGAEHWLVETTGALTEVPALERGAQFSGDRVVYPTRTGVAARPLTSETPLWTWDGKGSLFAANAIGVYLITQDRTVLGLSPATGHLEVVGCASSRPNEGWQIGHVYPTGGGYLALERTTNEPPTADDQQYFYGPRPVALVELYTPTKLPVWPGKFAACRPLGD
jgi:outer membrane protein assembly factor BamB